MLTSETQTTQTRAQARRLGLSPLAAALTCGLAFALAFLTMSQPASAAVPSPLNSCEVRLVGGVPTVSWTGGSGATAFVVFRNGGVRVRATGSSFADNRTARNTVYNYAVAPANRDGNGATRACGQVRTGTGGGTANATAPASCSLTPIFRKEVRITWSGGEGTSFVIRRNGGWLARVSGTSRSYQDLRAEHGRDYAYTIEAQRDGRSTGRTSCGNIVIPPPGNSWNRPQPPASCSVIRSAGSNRISWTSVPGTYVIIYRNGGWRGRVDFGTSFTDNRLAFGANYSYAVQTRNSSGYSDLRQCN